MSIEDLEKQETAANELHQKIYGNPANPAAPDAKAPETKPAEKKPEEGKPAETKPPETKPNDPPLKTLKAPPEKENDPEYWRQRAQLMAGKYDAEVPRYAQENRALKAEQARLTAELEAAKSRKPEPAAVEIPAEVTEKYGEDFIKDVRTIAGTQAQVQPNNDEVKQQLARLEKTIEQERFEKFKEGLSSKAPTWEALNTDPGFLTWLAGIDPMSGKPRQDLFDDAVAFRDVQRVSHFFNSFHGSENEQPGQYKPPPVTEQLTPNSSKASVPEPGKKIWTVNEVTQFYDDVRRNRVADADAARIEADIFAAQREGRIR
jgi:hypothetical protein